VESTARAAFDAGFHVTVATDAVTDRDEEAHRNSVDRIFPRMAETGTTDEILAVLDAQQPSAA
jgi:nicotinamidase-related amidase